MLIVAGDNPDRVRSEAAFARLCGVAPIPASSGMTTRHRLNRGGHRQANAALYRVVIVRMQHHDPTKAYVARRTAEGKSKAEIIRCLKRLGPRTLGRHATPADPCDIDHTCRLTDIGASMRPPATARVPTVRSGRQSRPSDAAALAEEGGQDRRQDQVHQRGAEDDRDPDGPAALLACCMAKIRPAESARERGRVVPG